MHLTVLGCSGSAPGPNAAASGYLVEAGDLRVALDLGNGTLAAMQARMDPFLLDALLLSHLHPDHCADFSALTVLRRYTPKPARDPHDFPLPVYGPTETQSRLVAAYAPDAAERATTDLSDIYDFRRLGIGPVTVGPLDIRSIRVAHPCESYGLRLTADGRTLAYTGDTGVCPAMVELAAGADLLLAEASWTHDPGNRPVGLHLSGREAGEMAAAAGVSRLMLTHVPPWTDPGAVLAEARSAYAGEVLLARAGASYPL
ncbi:MAG TPA: MBL fold metallo-hydrolase [Pseudonocardiaceae bacterium]